MNTKRTWFSSILLAGLVLVSGAALTVYQTPTPVIAQVQLASQASSAAAGDQSEFGYGLSVYYPDGNEAHDMGFNWIKVYDPPSGRQPTNVLYRVDIDFVDGYDLSALESRIRNLAMWDGENIDAYEIGNEVNIDGEWHSAPDAYYYVEALCTAHYAIRQVDPTAKVISAGLAPVGRVVGDWGGHAGHNGSVQDEREYLREFIDYNGHLCADAIGYHPMGFRADYDAEPDVDGGTPETDCTNGFCFRGAEKIYEVLQERGLGDKKIWATEVGWIVEPPNECLGHASWQGRHWQIVTPEKQAENLAGAFEIARLDWPWMEALFVFNLDFDEAPCYHACEQMRYYAISDLPAETALREMPKKFFFLPLVMQAHP